MNRMEAASEEALTLAGQLLAGELPPGAECIYNGRNRLYALTLPSGRRVCVKAFRRPGAFRGLIYGILSTPKSEKSYRNASRLTELGFMTPAPLAHAEERLWGGLRLGRSFYVCDMLEGATEIRDWQTWPDRDVMVEALGVEVARLMRAGVLFRDFSPGNVLVTNRNPYRFAYVDVNRTDFGVRSRLRMMSMFKRINIIEEETKRLARATARAMSWSEEDTQREALTVLRRFLWMKDEFLHPMKRFFKRLVGKN